MKRTLALVLLILAAIATGCASSRESLERSALFHPSRDMSVTPQMAGLEAEDVYITSGGAKIHGWFFPGGPDSMNVVYLHGNGGNISNLLGMIRFLQPLKLNFLAIDYRGYGLSEGAPSLDGIVEDTVAAVDWMVARRDARPGRVVLWGHSLGAAAALGAAQMRPGLGGVIIEAGFVSLKKIAAHHFPFIPSSMVSSKLDNLEVVKTLALPKLVIHGRKDEVIPFEHGVSLHAQACKPREFYPIDTAGHNDIYLKGNQEYLERLRAWLASL